MWGPVYNISWNNSIVVGAAMVADLSKGAHLEAWKKVSLFIRIENVVVVKSPIPIGAWRDLSLTLVLHMTRHLMSCVVLSWHRVKRVCGYDHQCLILDTHKLVNKTSRDSYGVIGVVDEIDMNRSWLLLFFLMVFPLTQEKKEY